MASKITLRKEGVEDAQARENFVKIQSAFDALKDLNFSQATALELTISNNLTNLKIPHRLGFTPNFVLQGWKTGTGSITYNYSSFDGDNIDITTSSTSSTDPMVVRFLVFRMPFRAL